MSPFLRSLPKVDAHHHLWDIEANDYPWLRHPGGWRTYGDYTPMCRNYLVDDFRADSAPHNVVKSVHVQANWNADDPVGETRWCQSVADAHGFPHAIVGHADLASPDLDVTLKAHRAHANFRGIRHILGHTDDPEGAKRPDPLDDRAWERGYARLAAHGLSFDMQLYPRQMKKAAALAARHPDVPVVVCHTGFPWDRSEEGLARWRDGMAALAALPHVHAKLSGPCMVMRDWTADTFADFVHRTIDLFGPARCMFASNVPPDALAKPYGEIYDAFYAWAGRYGAGEQRAMFNDAAAGFYRV